ncbi:MAG TPA: FAD-dependent oxidoreductase, partial [Polyangiaceae bacterium LLY-WYZ-15_(1-7)]|nr:FAD-dependent oxidoreductase [Polyangiaceae bacterium LLY-WYZ-15_(1-7)]
MSPDVIVVGGGVMGCMAALRLAEDGRRPLVLERSVPGAEASSAAAGILGPAVEAHHGHDAGHPHPGPRPRARTILSLGIRSRQLHAELAQQLRDDHGIDVGFRRCGVMRVARGEAEEAALRDHAALLEGRAKVEALGGDEARRREPALHPSVSAAIDLPEEAQLEPRLFLRGLAVAAE